jgi:RNA polymerase sigma factor (sigma-70 family)
MIQGKSSTVGRQLEALWTSGSLTGKSDAQLLSRFAAARDAASESAFRELVHRHGSMVMGVCRQILRHPHDADDAFQATFLVLVRKADSIRVAESLAPWLYAVAFRTARRARAVASRYRSTPVESLEDPMGHAASDSCHFDLRPLLHEELNRLPGKYRQPIVLCHLEGKTHEEAARLLQWPVGTVSGRLSRGRELLKSRLERRGLAVPSAIFSAPSLNVTLSVPVLLVESTLTAAMRFAAGQSVSAPVLSLTHGVLRVMLFNKVRAASIALLIVGGISGGAGAWARWASKSPWQTAQGDKRNPPGVQGAVASPGRNELPQTEAPASYIVNPYQPGTSGFALFQTGSILVVDSPDGTALEAKSVDVAGESWRRFPIPNGLKVSPIGSDDIVALAYQGKTIDQLAVFSAYRGEWSVVKLVQPIQERIVPVVGRGCALYAAGGVFYAFSAQTGAWDILHLPADEKAKTEVSVGPKYILVRQGNRLYVFSLKQGKWSLGVEMKMRPMTKANPTRETIPAR